MLGFLGRFFFLNVANNRVNQKEFRSTLGAVFAGTDFAVRAVDTFLRSFWIVWIERDAETRDGDFALVFAAENFDPVLFDNERVNLFDEAKLQPLVIRKLLNVDQFFQTDRVFVAGLWFQTFKTFCSHCWHSFESR